MEAIDVKRAFDLFCSIYGLIVAGPLLLIVAVLIKLESPGPAIFKQKRPTINISSSVLEYKK